MARKQRTPQEKSIDPAAQKMIIGTIFPLKPDTFDY